MTVCAAISSKKRYGVVDELEKKSVVDSGNAKCMISNKKLKN